MNSVSPALADGPVTGLWLRPGADPRNTGRAALPGDLASPPREVWRTGHVQTHAGEVWRLADPEPTESLLQVINNALMRTTLSGETQWPRPVVGVNRIVGLAPARSGASVLVERGSDELLLVRISDGAVLWNWLVPKPAHHVGAWKLLHRGDRVRLFVFPLGITVGHAFEFSADRDEPSLLWRVDYAPRFNANFGPSIVLEDMDADGEHEIVLAGKPAYVGVIDQNSGDVKFERRYTIQGAESDMGRPYGLLQTADINGDGYADVVLVSCQVEEYLAVLRNDKGRQLEPIWSRFVEKDFPADERQIRPNLSSLADVNGDGRIELVVGAFNLHGRNRWRTLVIDPLRGIDDPLQDWPDRYFCGCLDIDGDGVAEVIVEKCATRARPRRTTLEARAGRTGQVVASLDHATPAGAIAPRLPVHQAFMARHDPLLTLPADDGATGLLVRIAPDEQTNLWSAPNGEPRVLPCAIGSLSGRLLASPGGLGNMPLDLQFPPTGPAASRPLVCRQDERRELVIALSDGAVVGGAPDLERSGQWHDRWTLPGARASIWQVAPDQRYVVVTAEDADRVDVHAPRVDDQTPSPVFSLNLPADIAADDTGLLPYGAGAAAKLLVTMRVGTHKSSSTVFNVDGQSVWDDPEYGPYPSAAAAGDLDGDGTLELVVDDHGKQFIYDSDGRAKLIAQAWHDAVPGRADGSAYALPIIGPFGEDGQTVIVMAPGLMALETLDTDGSRLARWPFESPYVFDRARPAVGQLRGAGRWDIGIVHTDGTLHCMELPSLDVRWKMDLGTRLFGPARIICGDVNRDGRDEMIVGLPDGRVVAIADVQGAGTMLWQLPLTAAIEDLALADIDRDGATELIVTTRDGLLRIFR